MEHAVILKPEHLGPLAEQVSDLVIAKMRLQTQEKKNLLDTKAAAAHLGISPFHLRRLSRAGALKFHRRPGGRYGFLMTDLNEYIQKL